MDSTLLVALELGLVLGGVLAFAFWELFKLRRYRKNDSTESCQSKQKAP